MTTLGLALNSTFVILIMLLRSFFTIVKELCSDVIMITIFALRITEVRRY